MSNEFYQPKNLIQALKYKLNYEEATILAGGTDLVISMRNGKETLHQSIDLSKIPELKNIERFNDVIRIGSMVTFTDLIDSEVLQKAVPFLGQAAKSVGAPQIRNRGTIGGNICNASPAADGIPALVCLEAQVNLQSMNENGEIQRRTLSMEKFVVDKGRNALKIREILTSIDFLVPSNKTRMEFAKIGRRNALAVSRLNGACLLEIENNKFAQIRLVIGAATSKPERFSVVEDYLLGKELTEMVLKEAGRLASVYVLEQTGRRSSSTYKLPAIARFTEELIKKTQLEEVEICE